MLQSQQLQSVKTGATATENVIMENNKDINFKTIN